MKKPVLYVHGGSGNHGCEAIVRTLVPLLEQAGARDTVVIGANPGQDAESGLDKLVEIRDQRAPLDKRTWRFWHAYLMNRFLGKYVYLDILPCRKVVEEFGPEYMAFAIGGDTYSYGYSETNTHMHDLYRRQGVRTVLWGCSIDPALLDDQRVLKDIKNFDWIVARESLTRDALVAHGLENVDLVPDSAFLLGRQPCNESVRIREGKTIGINASPMIQKYGEDGDLVLRNYYGLIDYILEETGDDVALIPHVVWEQSDDRKVLNLLYEKYKGNGRVICVHNHNCLELKDIIARCRMMVAARTHASIAAYSSGIPTLVLGYSIKARGIAKDLFGTDEGHVLSVQSLTSENDLVEAFQGMERREVFLREHLQSVIPRYVERIQDAVSMVRHHIGEGCRRR